MRRAVIDCVEVPEKNISVKVWNTGDIDVTHWGINASDGSRILLFFGLLFSVGRTGVGLCATWMAGFGITTLELYA